MSDVVRDENPVMDKANLPLSREAHWEDVIRRQRAVAANAATRRERGRSALLRLRRMITENESRFLTALREDLGKPATESLTSEIAVTLNEIDLLLRKQRRFLRDRRIRTGPGNTARVSKRPYGSVLILSPWNYPLQLALLPLAGALVAGNGCFLKPSELSPTTSGLIAELAREFFREEELVIVEGDAEVSSALLRQDWDFIFFTGSERVGALVAARAAELRIPSILELGGKCPCIVDAKSVTAVTARRIVWGKFFNAGQTCITADHVWVEESAREPLVEEMKKQIVALYGNDPEKSRDYGRIIHDRHFARLTAMLANGRVAHGGRNRPGTRYLEPTIMVDPDPESPLMKEEIFGPILPILTWSDRDDLLRKLAVRPEPLAAYVFCEDEALWQELVDELRCGAICRNTVMGHAGKAQLPFGGVGASGYGRYHGVASFDAFTWEKVVYRTPRFFDPAVKYPPYNEKHLKWIRRLRRFMR